MYNEIDSYAAQWLRNLVQRDLIAPGAVDERSIADLAPDDVAGAGQRHFFAGIGGWSLALRLAGWPDDRDVWTGSCPCQPFSAAGKRRGTADERHLWPTWFRLIEACRPSIIFGEQVASKDALAWLDAVFADMEGAGYSCAAADLCAAGVGAPHIRQRLFWVAYRDDARLERRVAVRERAVECVAGAGGLAGRLADNDCGTGRQGCADAGRRDPRGDALAWAGPGGDGVAHWLGNGDRERLEGIGLRIQPRRPQQGGAETRWAGEVVRPGPVNGQWRSADWLYCRDDKWRPVESGSFPLADGVSGRVGRLRAYGNAIVPQVAAEFVGAVMEWLEQ